MSILESRFYTPALRWKKGEMEALGSLDEASKERLLPHLIFPPLKARDLEEQRPLSRDEYGLIQIGRLQRFWGAGPCLIDFRFLEFEPSDKGSDAARINEFLVNSRKFGCRLIPILDARVDSYRAGALGAHIRNAHLNAAIRLSLDDLQNDNFQAMLDILVASTQASIGDCILILDFGDAVLSSVPAFAEFTGEWLIKLRQFGMWGRVIVEASSYPRMNPANPNSETPVPRNEWNSWCQLAESDRDIFNSASFGDFGADHGEIDFDGGGRTITHLRYTTEREWIVGRGGSPTASHDGTIHTVAARLMASGGFMGADYSAGDEFIAACAAREAIGNGSTWRWANMVHHMTLTASRVGELVGSPFETPKRAPIAKQLPLLLPQR